jgi:RNA polymerase-binding transcription factor DksA
MDDADVVVERSEREIGFALRSFPGKPEAAVIELQCSLCGEDIPEARRAALREWGCETCAECQERIERGMGR